MQPSSSDAKTGAVTDAARKAVLADVQGAYPPELINRLDDQIVFNRKWWAFGGSMVEVARQN